MGVEENTSLHFSGMSDDDLESSLDDTLDTDDTGAEDTAQAAAGQTPAADDAAIADDGQAPEGQEGEEPRTVDLRALQEERELRKQERDRAAAAEAELARYRQAEAATLAAQHDAQIQATYEQILTEQGEDAAAGYIRAVTQQRESQLHQEFAHREAVNVLSLSEEMIREVHGPDYDTRLNRMAEVLGPEAFQAVVLRSLREAPKAPAKWLYDQAKTHFPMESDRQAAIQAEVAKQLAALQGKNKAPAVRGHQSIGHLSSSTQNPGAVKPVRKMSDAELERSLGE